MPLINGMKMACEPCIRGHRSTKCTHANERLMVPVRKPGRPLSACPHPHNQQCNCGGVTAAIPRKQACHCGGNSPALSEQALPQDSNPSPAEGSSPTKATFKVQKPSARPPSSRKKSYDPVNFERIDMSDVNIVPFEQQPQNVPLSFANGYTMPDPSQQFAFVPQYASVQSQYSHIPMPALQNVSSTVQSRTNGFRKSSLHSGLENVVEDPLAISTKLNNGTPNSAANGRSCCAPPSPPATVTNGGSNGMTNGGSCCAPKQPTHIHSSPSANSITEPQEAKAGSCCSSKNAPRMLKQEPTSSQGTPNITPQISHQILPQNGMHFNPALYPPYLPQTTVFTYPPTYGSFQNPLQPSAWLESVRANSYGHPQMPISLHPGSISFDAHLIPETLDTTHTCSCGDSCQCIGCAAHPYNDATQDYVRSAWSSMAMSQSPTELYNNGHPSNGNGQTAQPQSGEPLSSPTVHTPSSTTSGNGEEQILSAADFFFVNYPFSSDGCGGDTQSCPCGDDCQCLGCSIHRPPPIPCEGEKDVCPCGDDCECIGCEIHNGRMEV